VISAATFAKTNVDERDVCPELLERHRGMLLGDKGYIRPMLKEFLEDAEIYLQTPLRNNIRVNIERGNEPLQFERLIT
jgi:hypothetical protein